MPLQHRQICHALWSICIVLSVFSVHCFVLIFVRENYYGVSEKDVMVLA